jgi:hypothetical protein
MEMILMDQICMLGLHVDKFKHIVKFVCTVVIDDFGRYNGVLKEQAILALSEGSWYLRSFSTSTTYTIV